MWVKESLSFPLISGPSMSLAWHLPTTRRGMMLMWKQSRWPVLTPKWVLQLNFALSPYLMSTAPWKERTDCINWPYHDMSQTSNVTLTPVKKIQLPLSAQHVLCTYVCLYVMTFRFHSCPLNTTPCPSVSHQMEWDNTAVRILDKSSGEQSTLDKKVNNGIEILLSSVQQFHFRGERIVNTPYKIGMNKNVECAALCKDKK